MKSLVAKYSFKTNIIFCQGSIKQIQNIIHSKIYRFIHSKIIFICLKDCVSNRAILDCFKGISFFYVTNWDHLSLSGTIWDHLSPSRTISLQLGTSHSMLDHLRLLRHQDFLWFHIHVIILIQLVCHIHIADKCWYFHQHLIVMSIIDIFINSLIKISTECSSKV